MDVHRSIILSCCLFSLCYNQINGQVEEMTAEIVTVVEQETAILPCSKNLTGDDKVIWRDYNGTLLAVDGILTVKTGRVSVDLPSPYQWNLHIQDVQYSDQGIYECRINSHPPVLKPVILVVQIPPTIITSISSFMKGYESTDVKLKCVASGIPPPTVKWYKIAVDYNSVNEELEGDSEDFYIDDETSLIIRNMTRNKEGSYECHAFNGVGEGAKTRYYLSYRELPSFVGPLFEDVAANDGGTALLPCAVKNRAGFGMAWRRHSSVISYGYEIFWSDRFTVNRSPGQWDWNLQIEPVSTWDSAIYTCEVTRDSMYDTILTKTVNLTVT